LALRLKGTHASDNKPEANAQPHQLMMSATPIPRTLAMSYYADLDVSVIDEMPPGRTPVTTKLVSDTRRDEVITRVRDACAAGSQAYWVCPLVEEIESEETAEGKAPVAKKSKGPPKPGRAGLEALQLKAAMETHETLSVAFPDLKVGLAHGRLKSEEKSAVMGAFQRNEVQLLVATTVIEVGVDVPNASLMVIENAERMGLSQLHQLRGRVGRGATQSACILLYRTPLSPTARERLKIIFENTDGFEVARHDLRMRGPGELLGARQSGVPLLRFADLSTDVDLLDAARDAAAILLVDNPQAARAHLHRWLGGRGEFLKV
jgi:ATP-dependent DNA helicase RecG